MPKASATAERSATIPGLRLRQLVDQALESLPKPYTEQVIEDVFVAIEGNPEWRATYDRIVYESGKAAAASWAGFWISHAVMRTGDQRESASRATLLDSYARLVTPTQKRNKKVKEPDALRAMHEHFVAQRDHMPAEIRDYRETIVALIMDGIGTEAAFAQALDRPTLAH